MVVSAGGGAAQGRLPAMALAARAQSPLAEARWCFVTGPNAPDGLIDSLRSALRPGDLAVPFRSDFPSLLAAARLSISQAGYNTCCDLLRAGCRSVLVPFAAGGEPEQTLRAARLAERGLAVVIAEASLEPAALAAAIERVRSPPAVAARGQASISAAPTTRRRWSSG